MTHENQQPMNSNLQPEKNAEIDRTLDAALAKYASVEPRQGLEQRILANLRIEQTKQPSRLWLHWSVAGALMAVIVAAVLLAWRSGVSHPAIAKQPSTTIPAAPSPQPALTANGRTPAPAHPRKSTPLHSPSPTRTATLTPSTPKLDQFPSPRPLSPQEQILASYVSEYPEQAALIAQARMEAIRRDAEERNVISNRDQNSQR